MSRIARRGIELGGSEGLCSAEVGERVVSCGLALAKEVPVKLAALSVAPVKSSF